MNNHNGPVTAEEFDRLFVDMPVWMLNALDREADRLNISRQAVIKTMLDAQLRSGNAPRA